MASVWHGSPRSRRSPDAHRSLWMVPVALWIAALVVALGFVVCLFVIAPIVAAHALGNALNGLGPAVEKALQADQSAGTAANDAADALGPQLGSLTPPVLNTSLPKYQWVDAATSVRYSATRPIVSMSASGTHIETAVQEVDGSCSFGLTITSNTDPLTAEDHVAGLGEYYHLVGTGTYWQSVYHPSQCAADQAPTSGWISWPRSVINLTAGS